MICLKWHVKSIAPGTQVSLVVGGLVPNLCPTFVTTWTVAHQVPLSVGFPRQKYWSDLSFPSPEDFSNSGMKPMSLVSLTLAGRFFTTSATSEALFYK